MIDTHNLLLFIVSGMLLNIMPGADSLFIITRTITQGLRAGVVATLGIGLGCYLHIFAAAFGLSAILATSAFAFTIVKWIGAAYLIYIGISFIRSASQSTQIDQAQIPSKVLSMRSIFMQGFLTNALNPKVALFFLSFVPQFIDPTSTNKALSFIFLGVIFNFTGTLWCFFLAWSAANFRHVAINHRVTKWLSRTVGGVFIFIGLRLAFSRQN